MSPAPPTRRRPPCKHGTTAMIQAFGGKGYQATTPGGGCLPARGAVGGPPALIDCLIDPSDGTESGNIAPLNPRGITVQEAGNGK